jgi:hypothetical protein
LSALKCYQCATFQFRIYSDFLIFKVSSYYDKARNGNGS